LDLILSYILSISLFPHFVPISLNFREKIKIEKKLLKKIQEREREKKYQER
jgi:hypothetical protein